MDESGQAAGADPLFGVIEQGTEQRSLFACIPTTKAGGRIGLFLFVH
jgi:hypothetical protein